VTTECLFQEIPNLHHFSVLAGTSIDCTRPFFIALAVQNGTAVTQFVMEAAFVDESLLQKYLW
jgi:hypothetical protein